MATGYHHTSWESRKTQGGQPGRRVFAPVSTHYLWYLWMAFRGGMVWLISHVEPFEPLLLSELDGNSGWDPSTSSTQSIRFCCWHHAGNFDDFGNQIGWSKKDALVSIKNIVSVEDLIFGWLYLDIPFVGGVNPFEPNPDQQEIFC